MKIIYLGHSCFQITIGDKNIVLDPFIRGNELAIAAGINIDEVKADYIFVTHGHFDHIEDLKYLAEKTNALVIAAFEICTWLGKQGYAKSHPMNVGGKKLLDFGTVKLTYALHSSSLPDGSYAGIPSGFLITAEGKSIYYAGDTALTYEMKLLGDLNKIDYAILPIGGNFTMDASDANIAADFIKCKNIIAMHYDTFGHIKINHDESKQIFNQSGKELHFIKIGDSIEI